MKSSFLVFALIVLICFGASFVTNIIYLQKKRQTKTEIAQKEMFHYSQTGLSTFSKTFYHSVRSTPPAFKPIIMDLEVHAHF